MINTIQNTHSSDEELLNRSEAAKLLGVKENTLAVWASSKRYKLPYVKVGRLVRYRKSDVIRFLQQRTVESTSNQ